MGVTPGVRVGVRPTKAPVTDGVDVFVIVRDDVGAAELDTVTVLVLDGGFGESVTALVFDTVGVEVALCPGDAEIVAALENDGVMVPASV